MVANLRIVASFPCRRPPGSLRENIECYQTIASVRGAMPTFWKGGIRPSSRGGSHDEDLMFQVSVVS